MTADTHHPYIVSVISWYSRENELYASVNETSQDSCYISQQSINYFKISTNNPTPQEAARRAQGQAATPRIKSPGRRREPSRQGGEPARAAGAGEPRAGATEIDRAEAVRGSY